VATSITGMVGVTVRGPTDGKPRLVTNFNEYQSIFGGFLPTPDEGAVRKWGSQTNLEGGAWWLFPLAVKGFFDNGGQQLYVKRVFSGGDTGATAASGSPIRGLVSEVAKDAAADATTLVLRHLLGIQHNSVVTVVRGDNGQVIGQPTVSAYDATRNTITLSAPLGQEVRLSRGDVVEIVSPAPVNGNNPANATATFRAKALGEWGNDLQAQIRPMVGATMSILPSTTAGPLAVTALEQDVPSTTAQVVVRVTPGTFDTSIDNQWVLIMGQRFQASAASITASLLTFTISPAQHVDWGKGLAVQRLRTAMLGGGNTQLRISGAQNLYGDAIVELDSGTTKEVRSVSATTGDVVTFDAALTGAYLEGDRLRVVEAEVLVRYQPAGGQLIEEDFTNLRIADAGTALGLDANSLWVAVNAQSQLVTLSQGAAFSTVLTAFPTASPHGGWLTAPCPACGHRPCSPASSSTASCSKTGSRSSIHLMG
jgi:hypothetical protein